MAAWSLSKLSWVGTRVFLVGTMMVRLVISSLSGDSLLPLIGKSAAILSTSMPSKVSRPPSWNPRCRGCWWVLVSTCLAALGPIYWGSKLGSRGTVGASWPRWLPGLPIATFFFFLNCSPAPMSLFSGGLRGLGGQLLACRVPSGSRAISALFSFPWACRAVLLEPKAGGMCVAPVGNRVTS